MISKVERAARRGDPEIASVVAVCEVGARDPVDHRPGVHVHPQHLVRRRLVEKDVRTRP